MKRFSEILRKAIVDCGESQNALGRRAGVDAAQICRFLGGKQGLSSGTIDRLVEALGIEVRVPARARRGGETR